MYLDLSRKALPFPPSWERFARVDGRTCLRGDFPVAFFSHGKIFFVETSVYMCLLHDV